MMEPPVGRVGILVAAVGVHGEVPHGGLFSIIGQVGDDREPCSAVRAVGERVEVSAIEGIEQLPEAIVADRHIIGDAHPLLSGRARDDPESFSENVAALIDLDRIKPRQRWQLGPEASNELLPVPIDQDHHVGAIVLHRAAQPHRRSNAVHGGAETHSLNDPMDGDPHDSIPTSGTYKSFFQ